MQCGARSSPVRRRFWRQIGRPWRTLICESRLTTRWWYPLEAVVAASLTHHYHQPINVAARAQAFLMDYT
jgi:hypothetical protein